MRAQIAIEAKLRGPGPDASNMPPAYKSGMPAPTLEGGNPDRSWSSGGRQQEFDHRRRQRGMIRRKQQQQVLIRRLPMCFEPGKSPLDRRPHVPGLALE